jgi:hypothetical protein
MHALGKRILGVSAAEIRSRLADLSADRLPTVEAARLSLRGGRSHIDAAVAPAPQRVAHLAEEEIAALTNSVPAPSAPSTEAEVHLVLPAILDDQPGPIPEPIDVTAITPEPAASRNSSQKFTEVLKRQFRAAVQALLKRMPVPTPRQRRRRTGDTVRSFRLVARNILKPIIRLPVISHAVGFLNDSLPWLHLWEWNEFDDHDSGGSSPRDDNHHSPHP